MSSVVVSFYRFTYKHSGEVIPGLPTPAPCPFCGEAKDVTVEWHGAFYHGDCDNCGAEGPWGTTPLEAAKYWNDRTPSR